MANKHDTVGVDLVAMCVNDIITAGAEPLFFLDYFATGKLSADDAVDVVKGIAEGCKEAGCALVGGETAEMPGFYGKGEYDLSGFVVGVVDAGNIVDGSTIKAGDVLVGLASNGLHSNGYSLVRKIFFDIKEFDIVKYLPELGTTLAEELLRPTRIYVNAVKSLLPAGGVGADVESRDVAIDVKGMAHITGGGITENLPRVLPEGLAANVREGSWVVPKVFDVIKESGNVSDEEMKRTFNMGIGYVIVLNAKSAGKAVDVLGGAGYVAGVIGEITEGSGEVNYV
jgi:phosphoribosylformylglycinamidine cyclo-ligase